MRGSSPKHVHAAHSDISTDEQMISTDDEARPFDVSKLAADAPISDYQLWRDRDVWPVVMVVFVDYLILALPRSLFPQLLNDAYGGRVYVLYGIAEAFRGALTFLPAPAIGAVSDVVGRKALFITCVVGTAAPFATLAFTDNLDVYLILFAATGVFASTFPLAFAYLSDFVPKASRANAYGLVLGVGLGGAFMIGPPVGALLARARSTRFVFQLCFALTIVNTAVAVCCIRARVTRRDVAGASGTGGPGDPGDPGDCDNDGKGERRLSPRELCRRANPLTALRLVRTNGAIRLLASITFFYYVALWGCAHLDDEEDLPR